MSASTDRRPVFYFIGDSLTQDGGNPETSGWITLLQHKHIRSVDAINRGLSGYNTRWFIEHALPVFAKELKSHYAPSLVTLWLGANDAALLSGSEAYQHVTLDDYRANITLILRTLAPLLPASAKILLITPPAVIDAARRAHSTSGEDLDRCNDAAGGYARVCVEVGKAEGVAVLDLHTFFNATYPQEAERSALFSDGLHFTSKGNTIVAQQVAGKIAELFGEEELARLDAWQLPNWRDFIAKALTPQSAAPRAQASSSSLFLPPASSFHQPLPSTSLFSQSVSMGVMASTERRPTFYFVGDSITEFGSDPHGSGFIALLQKEYVRCVDMINRGLAGYNTRWEDVYSVMLLIFLPCSGVLTQRAWVAQHALPVFENELATQFQANFVTVFLGANDAALPNGPNKNQYVPLDEYKTNLTTILTILRPHLSPKAKFLLITPPAVIDSQRGGKDRSNEAAGEYARACIDVAKAENVAVLDLHTYFNKTYPDEAERKTFFVDGLHFSPKGNEVVAKMIDVKIKAIFDKDEVDRFHHMQLPGWDHWVK